MKNNNFLKTIVTLFIYILTAGGALIMILPFAWMIMTSIKTEGEVSSWPPVWTTKNFANEREIKIQKLRTVAASKGSMSLSEFRSQGEAAAYNENKFAVYLNDDVVKNGILKLNLSSPKYGNKDSFNSFMSSLYNYFNTPFIRDDLKTIITETTDITPQKMEEIYFNLFDENDGYYKKTNIIRYLEKDLATMSGIVDNLKTTYSVDSNFKSQSEKDAFISTIDILSYDLKSINQRAKSMSTGMGLISTKDIELLKDLMTEFSSKLKPFNNESLSEANKIVQENLYSSVLKNINSLEFFNYFFGTMKKNEENSTGSFVLKFRIPDDSIISDNLRKDMDKIQLSKSFKEILLTSINSVNGKALKEKVIQNAEDKFTKELRSQFTIEDKRVSEFLQYIRDLAGNDISSTDDFTYYMDEEKSAALTLLIKGKENNFFKILEDRATLDNDIKIFSDYHSEAISKVQIIEAPSFIEKVLLRNYSNIEIYTKNIYGVWFLNDNSTLKGEFSFFDIVKNVFQNYADAWNAAPFSKYYMNTVFMAVLTTILEILVGAMAAFAFAKLNFWGKDFLFSLFLSTMMIPGEVMLVPNYITISRFKWIDSYYALIIPWIISVFAIFLLRQQFLTVPNDLWDAAKIDGASSWRFLWTVMVPLSKPAILTGGLLKFVGSWNAFLWVLIVTKSPEMRTLAVGLQTFTSDAGTKYNLLMAASTFTILPVILIFIFLQRYFVEGISRSGLKG